ncbi:class I SAM-dependent methyltransferase [Anaerobranca gottschalkii]|uniref:Methyltransferase domain-containing protein n=1 Tax=Anaerobranca gottschalkii DSM 13577 TaxID=1120990 RepID=A0A1I0CJQ7_9FIRM|nr:SAM-dependent methyltransferase [Anaerobranca gottschalkii]SET19881.1 Methyltransferase domain-containing protein [Anaerobranca gottschalkii DSM 13577]
MSNIRNSLQALMMRINDKNTFVSLEVINFEGKSAKILYSEEDLIWQYKNKRERLALTLVSDKIIEFLAGKDGKVEILERGTKILLDINKGKVKVNFSTLDEPPSKHLDVEEGTRQQFIKKEQAAKLLKVLGIMNTLGEIPKDKRRKYYQIDRFVELLDNFLKDWPQDKELVVVDCGCGKSYLSFVLNYYLQDHLRKRCYFIGIDANPEVIKGAEKIRDQLGYRNMEFHATKIENFYTEREVNLVLSLHACDTATDQQLALGIRLKADYIVAVPCCQKDLREQLNYNQLESFARFPILKNKISDIITDGLRVLALEAHGYKVSVVEYVSPLETPKNIMIRGEKKGENPKGMEKYLEAKKYWGVTPALDKYLY